MLASSKFSGQRVLIIENERRAAELMTRAVIDGGGTVVAQTSDVVLALVALRTADEIDCVVVDVALAIIFPEPIVPLLSRLGIKVVFVCFDDDIFDDESRMVGLPGDRASEGVCP